MSLSSIGTRLTSTQTNSVTFLSPFPQSSDNFDHFGTGQCVNHINKAKFDNQLTNHKLN